MNPLLEVLNSFIQVPNLRQATKFLAHNKIIRATRPQYKGRPMQGNFELKVTIGKPNFEEREFVKKLKQAGEPFPVKKVQWKFFKRV